MGEGFCVTEVLDPFRAFGEQSERMNFSMRIVSCASFFNPESGVIAANQFCTSATQIPAFPGAYLLLIKLTEPIVVRLSNMPSTSLIPGRYLYAGSAHGPGGLKARVSRHMRRAKPHRWHIDQLTETGDVLGAWIFPGGEECDLVERLSALPIPIARFGNSDCGRCRSHLLGPIEGLQAA